MAGLSTYAADKLLDALLRDVTYTSTETYVALFTTTPTMPAGTGGVEVIGTAYVRVRVDNLLAAASQGQSVTNAAVPFPQATGPWGDVAGVGVFDALTGGNLLAAGALSESITINAGDTFQLPSGELVIALD